MFGFSGPPVLDEFDIEWRLGRYREALASKMKQLTADTLGLRAKDVIVVVHEDGFYRHETITRYVVPEIVHEERKRSRAERMFRKLARCMLAIANHISRCPGIYGKPRNCSMGFRR